MFLTNKARYAVMGMLEMAAMEHCGIIKLSEIAKRQEIDVQFLEQIFAKLKKSGFIEAIRGPGGGYRLAKKSEDISISDIIESVSEEIKMTRCSNKTSCTSHSTKCTAHHLWFDLERQIAHYFDSKTLHGVLNQKKAFKGNFNQIYLDNNATTDILPIVKDAVIEMMSHPMNASSVHSNGRMAKHYLETSRSKVKNMVNAGHDYGLIFTSSGTEANNLAISGLHGVHPYISTIEHPSIMNLVPYAHIPVLPSGVMNIDALHQFLHSLNEKKALISIMLANNETGVIQPIAEIALLAKSYGALIHTDATQCPGKIAINIEELGVDMMTISAHKFGGPMGAAALIYKKNLDLHPIIKGGGQEYRVRSGTHNLPAIYGFAIACDFEPQYRKLMAKTELMRDYLEDKISHISDNVLFFGRNSKRLPNTSSIGMPNVSAESQLMNFDMNKIAVSYGSACSSGSSGIPHVQMSMGYSLEQAKTAIRVSLGINNTYDEIDKFIDIWNSIYLRSNNLIKDAV